MSLEAETLERESAEAAPTAPATINRQAQQKLQGIAILGSNPANVMDAPFGDPGWLIYACSPHNVEHRTLPRVDQWFEVHDPIEDKTRKFGYLYAVSQMPFVWMRDEAALKSGLFRGARRYPSEKIRGTARVETIKKPTGQYQQAVGPDGKPGLVEVLTRETAEIPNNDGVFAYNMFTSSIAWMLAKAILDCEEQGIRNIGLWGIMQASETEYSYQRPGLQYFFDQAVQRGINVLAPRESCLFDAPKWVW